MPQPKKNILEHAVVLLSFVGLVFVMTFPVVTKLTSGVAGSGGDIYQTAADTISTKMQFEQLGGWGALREILVHSRLDPNALNAYYSLLFGFPLGFNLFWLFSFFMAGIGTYYLVRTLLREYAPKFQGIPYVSFFAGIVYAFTPAHFYWANGFRGATHIEWIPWTILFLHLVLKQPTFWRFVGVFAFALLLVQGEEHFAAFFSLILVPYLLFNRKKVASLFRQKRPRLYAIAGLGICFAVFTLSYLPLIRVSLSSNNFLNPGLDQAITYSNDLLGIVTPAYNQTLWGDAFAPLRETFTGNRYKSPSYIGLTVLILAGFALWRKRSSVGRFWLFTGLGFFILSLGPVLHVAGIIEPRFPLPYLAIYKFVPFFENIRTVNRLIIFAVLGFSIAASFGLLTFLEQKVRSLVWQRLLPILLGVVVLVEYFPLPIPTTALTHSPFYDQLRNEPGEFSILEIPSATNYDAASRSVFYKTIHQKTLAGLYQFARTNASDPTYQRNLSVPILNELLYQLPRNAQFVNYRAIDTSDPVVNTAALNREGVRYITIHKRSIGEGEESIRPNDYALLRAFLRDYLKTKIVYEDEELVAYQVLDIHRLDVPLLTFGDGWQSADVNENETIQWTNNSATLLFELQKEPGPVQLSFRARASAKKIRTIGITANNEPLGQYLIQDTLLTFELNIENLRLGTNSIVFQVYDSSGLPVEENSPSVAFANIRTQRATSRPASQNFFGASLTGRVLEVPYTRVTNFSQTDPVELITTQDILEFYRVQLSPSSVPRLPFVVDSLMKTVSSSDTPRGNQSFEYYRSATLSVLKDLGVRYLAIPTTSETPTTKLIEHLDNLGFPKYVETQTHSIFSVPGAFQPRVPLLILEGKWGRLESRGLPKQSRRLTATSQIKILNRGIAPLDVVFRLSAKRCRQEKRRFSLSLNDEPRQTDFELTNKFVPIAVPLRLLPGENTLSFDVTNAKKKLVSEKELAACPVWLANLSL